MSRSARCFELSDRLVLDIYKATARFPKSEAFGLTGQMRRAAASIPMNLAEGSARSSAKELARSIHIAAGSCEELRYQLHLSLNPGHLSEDVQSRLDSEYKQVKKMLSKLLAAVSC